MNAFKVLIVTIFVSMLANCGDKSADQDDLVFPQSPQEKQRFKSATEEMGSILTKLNERLLKASKGESSEDAEGACQWTADLPERTERGFILAGRYGMSNSGEDCSEQTNIDFLVEVEDPDDDDENDERFKDRYKGRIGQTIVWSRNLSADTNSQFRSMNSQSRYDFESSVRESKVNWSGISHFFENDGSEVILSGDFKSFFKVVRTSGRIEIASNIQGKFKMKIGSNVGTFIFSKRMVGKNILSSTFAINNQVVDEDQFWAQLGAGPFDLIIELARR